MSHDFAKQKSKGKPIASKGGLPAWFWLFTGIITGLFFAFLIYLSGISISSKGSNTPQGQNTESDLTQKIKQQAERLREGKEALEKPEFTFYQRLPELTIETPKPRVEPQDSNKKAYVLQAGSFKSSKDADALKAQLIIQGLDVRIKTVRDSNKQEWHRVQVGPYTSQNKLNKAQDILANSDIPSMLMEDN